MQKESLIVFHFFFQHMIVFNEENGGLYLSILMTVVGWICSFGAVTQDRCKVSKATEDFLQQGQTLRGGLLSTVNLTRVAISFAFWELDIFLIMYALQLLVSDNHSSPMSMIGVSHFRHIYRLNEPALTRRYFSISGTGIRLINILSSCRSTHLRASSFIILSRCVKKFRVKKKLLFVIHSKRKCACKAQRAG
jgi:hypothetical protein